jgi:membrane dipeptidase
VGNVKNFFVDGHNDALLNYYSSDDYHFEKNNPEFHVDLPALEEGEIGVEVFAVCTAHTDYDSVKKTLQMIDKFWQLVETNQNMEIIERYKDIEEITEKDKIAGMLAIEGAEAVYDLSALRNFYRLGVRLITLAWSKRNQLAEGIDELRANGGVTELGKKVIKEMNRLGMVIDVSHLTPNSFWDVIEFSNKPIVASHSNAKEVCNHPRNLNDKQIIALAENGGLMGINFCPIFLSNNGQADMLDIIKHIKHIKNLVGIEYVGLGTDYDGISQPPIGLERIDELPALKEKLIESGFSKEEVTKLCRDNWLNLFKRVLK